MINFAALSGGRTRYVPQENLDPKLVSNETYATSLRSPGFVIPSASRDLLLAFQPPRQNSKICRASSTSRNLPGSGCRPSHFT